MRGCERTRSALLFILLFLAIPAFAVSDIAVSRNWDGVAIPNGGAFTFDPVAAGAADSRLFRIANTGSTNLNLTNATALVTGTCFSQIETPSTPIAPGGASYVRVRLQCATGGTKTGALTIRSDDPDENPYTISLSGTVLPPPAPDISVARDWDGVNVPIGGSVPFGNAIPAGTATSLRFRISNGGNANLDLTNAASLVSGTCFSQIETPVTPVAPGASAYVRVRLQCAAAGTYNGAVTISSNDPDENPYQFFVSGTVVPPPPPDISLWRDWDGAGIANGGSVPFGNAIPAGTATSLRFRITNDGPSNLDLTNAAALVSGTCFSQIETPSTPVAPGASSYLRVRLQCAAAGTYSGTVSISSNDPDESPYRFFVSGTVVPPPPPEISVLRDWDGVAVAQNSTFTFLNPVPAGQADSYRFRITNSGSGNLDLTNATALVSGTCFSQIETPSTPVAPGGSSYVRVRLQCATPGTYSGTVSIASNDADENPYRFTVAGTVTTPASAEIAVTRAWDDVAVASGGSFAFPDPVRAGATDSRLFRITNSGNGTLTLANPTTLVSGSCFSLIEQPTATVAANGGTTQFRVRLQCAAPGTYTGAISIQSNDSDENPYVINLSGTVVANGATYVSQLFPASMNANQFYDVSVTMRNSGSTTWTAAKNSRLGIRPDTATSQWRFDGRLYLAAGDSIAPGASKTFTGRLQAPATAGTYQLQWQMVEELVQWFGDVSPLVTVTVGAARNDAEFVSQSVPPTMNAGQKYTVSVTMKNSGGTTWSETTHHRLANQIAGDPFTHRRLLPTGVTVAPGAQYTFSWQVTAPATAGTYTFQWRMVQELVEWFGPFTPSTAVTVRIATPPVVDEIIPDTIRTGTIETVTVRGHRLGKSTVKFGSLDAGVATPIATLVSISTDGTTMTVRVDATNPAVEGFHGLVVKNADGNGAGEVRIVPNRPVVDVYTPSEASWGDLYFFSAAGVNLSGVQVVPMSSAVQFVGIEGDDGMLSGILEVDPGAGDINTTVELRGPGGIATIPLELRDRSALTQETRLAGKSTANGSEGLWVQDAVSMMPSAPAKFLDWEITCRYRRDRSSGRSGVLVGLREVGKRLNPHILDNFDRGETRRIQTLVTVYSFSINVSIDIFCRINSEGVEDLDIHFCILVDSYVETIGLGGQRITVEACTGTNERVSITGSGFWNFAYRFGQGGANPTSPCVKTVDRSANPFDGPRLTDVTMEQCCAERLSLDIAYKLGEDADNTRHEGDIDVGEVTPDPQSCPLSLLTIIEPPHDPDPPDLGDNFSFLAQRAFSATPDGDVIEAEAELDGFGDPAQILWTVTPSVGSIREVTPSTRKGTTLSFIPHPGAHPQRNPGNANCNTGTGSPGSGNCGRSAPLKYTIKAELGDTFEEVEIVQDETDIIRQEYRNHGITVPARSEFHESLPTAQYGAREVNNTAYDIMLGDTGTIAQVTNNFFNIKVHDDTVFAAFGQTGLPSNGRVVGPGAEIDEVGAILTTWACYPNPPGSCDDVRSGQYILAGPNGTAETRARVEITNYRLHIESGWRNPERNEAVGGALRSLHQAGNAVDLHVPAIAGYTTTQLWCLARTAGRAAGYTANTEDGPANTVPCRRLGVDHVHVSNP